MKTGLQVLLSLGISQPALALQNNDSVWEYETVVWQKKSFWYALLSRLYAY
jgi:hypothetical protein